MWRAPYHSHTCAQVTCPPDSPAAALLQANTSKATARPAAGKVDKSTALARLVLVLAPCLAQCIIVQGSSAVRETCGTRQASRSKLAVALAAHRLLAVERFMAPGHHDGWRRALA